ncbi:MAG: XTP/dITP diphosphatase [Lachnospiraceae bacterium]|nr:XTP/dITP diphosphatase [Lachnospiraceae bacterium]MBR2530728.1 XTP/dITP diphosphatase [Lachnospiraceae bacterium]
MKVIFATGNENKLREIRQITQGMDIEIISMKDAGYYTDVEETGSTFEENAYLKASAIAARCHLPTLADDSGLEIDYLGKEPGIYSSRYMGEDTPYPVKNAELLRRLEGVPDEQRTARFVCAVCYVRPDGSSETVRQTMEGRIAHKIAGSNGFGYDPIFFVPEKGCTSAELSPEDKNMISHRGKALRMMKEILEKEPGV